MPSPFAVLRLKDAYVFVSERDGPISPIGFHRLIQRVGLDGLPVPISTPGSRFQVVTSISDAVVTGTHVVGLVMFRGGCTRSRRPIPCP
jgi:hypothetical protein